MASLASSWVLLFSVLLTKINMNYAKCIVQLPHQSTTFSLNELLGVEVIVDDTPAYTQDKFIRAEISNKGHGDEEHKFIITVSLNPHKCYINIVLDANVTDTYHGCSEVQRIPVFFKSFRTWNVQFENRMEEGVTIFLPRTSYEESCGVTITVFDQAKLKLRVCLQSDGRNSCTKGLSVYIMVSIIVAMCIIVALICGVIIWLYCRHSQKKTAHSESIKTDPIPDEVKINMRNRPPAPVPRPHVHVDRVYTLPTGACSSSGACLCQGKEKEFHLGVPEYIAMDSKAAGSVVRHDSDTLIYHSVEEEKPEADPETDAEEDEAPTGVESKLRGSQRISREDEGVKCVKIPANLHKRSLPPIPATSVELVEVPAGLKCQEIEIQEVYE